MLLEVNKYIDQHDLLNKNLEVDLAIALFTVASQLLDPSGRVVDVLIAQL